MFILFGSTDHDHTFRCIIHDVMFHTEELNIFAFASNQPSLGKIIHCGYKY